MISMNATRRLAAAAAISFGVSAASTALAHDAYVKSVHARENVTAFSAQGDFDTADEWDGVAEEAESTGHLDMAVMRAGLIGFGALSGAAVGTIIDRRRRSSY
jgi:hypothetical protein